MALNLGGVMLGTQHAVSALRRRGGGAIVNVSSVAGIGWEPYASPEYAAAKAAVARFSASLGTLAREGIRVNCICPDWVAVEAIVAEKIRTPPDRWAEIGPPELVPPELVADAIVRLACDGDLSGRVLLCPCGGAWGLVPVAAPY